MNKLITIYVGCLEVAEYLGNSIKTSKIIIKDGVISLSRRGKPPLIICGSDDDITIDCIIELDEVAINWIKAYKGVYSPSCVDMGLCLQTPNDNSALFYYGNFLGHRLHISEQSIREYEHDYDDYSYDDYYYDCEEVA